MENRYTKDNKYYQETIIPCYDADASFHLKPAAFMDLAQELAYWAAGELGFGFDDLQTHGTAWVLSRMHIRFTDMPLWRDKVRRHAPLAGQSPPDYLAQGPGRSVFPA